MCAFGPSNMLQDYGAKNRLKITARIMSSPARRVNRIWGVTNCSINDLGNFQLH